jgi:5-(carboxyamino)imidazole ribonucleotide synthase
MGYRVCTWDPDPESPAAMVSDYHIQGDFLSLPLRERFRSMVSAATLEFENVPSELLDALSESIRLSPDPRSVTVSQDRILEKDFLNKLGIPTVPYRCFLSEDDLDCAEDGAVDLFPGILKRSRWGYDGKGQIHVRNLEELKNAYRNLGGVPCLLEKRISLEKEISLILSGNRKNGYAFFPLVENIHINGILHTSVSPAKVPPEVVAMAREMSLLIAQGLSYEGVLTVEFFLDRQGRMLVNELAPRPHNSGHFTIDSCAVSQFSQQIRVLIGAPPSVPVLAGAAAMVNLLGDLWERGEPDFSPALSCTSARLHLYGKKEARAGRKMGHITVLETTSDKALSEALRIYEMISHHQA